jgi:pyrroloquinoline quinone (PQQ) biosynthesis protein C
MENTTDNSQQITIADLNLLKNIVDLASTRGAFRGTELSQVGQVYDKLTAFLDAIMAQAQAQESENQSAETPTESNTPQGE